MSKCSHMEGSGSLKARGYQELLFTLGVQLFWRSRRVERSSQLWFCSQCTRNHGTSGIITRIQKDHPACFATWQTRTHVWRVPRPSSPAFSWVGWKTEKKAVEGTWWGGGGRRERRDGVRLYKRPLQGREDEKVGKMGRRGSATDELSRGGS
jgi:uncharacterized protein YcaQ